MKNYLDHAADSRAQRKSQEALEESSQHNIDTARQALWRMQRTHRRNIDFYVCAKILLSLLLTAAALTVVLWSRHSGG
jgi:hypothetical protein